jgi:hypothetical protein
MQTTFQAADKAIAAYDAYIFGAVGRAFDSEKADLLAAVAMVECEAAMKDRSENRTTRNIYRAAYAEFRSIAA